MDRSIAKELRQHIFVNIASLRVGRLVGTTALTQSRLPSRDFRRVALERNKWQLHNLLNFDCLFDAYYQIRF